MAHETFHVPIEKLSEKTKTIHYAIASLMEEFEAVHLSCAFDLKIPDARIVEVIKLIAHINGEVLLGHFDVWQNADIVIFRQSLLLSGGVEPTGRQVEVLLSSALEACEAYYQAFQFVVWSGMDAQSAVSAAELSLEGVRAENSVGNRTILEILNAQQELLQAQVQLIQARRNAYVAGFTLLAAMGRAEARDLGLEAYGPLYDPVVNYDRAKSIIWDWQSDPAPVTQASRTVDIPPQDANIPPQQQVSATSSAPPLP